jgi:hypothetical protein
MAVFHYRPVKYLESSEWYSVLLSNDFIDVQMGFTPVDASCQCLDARMAFAYLLI